MMKREYLNQYGYIQMAFTENKTCDIWNSNYTWFSEPHFIPNPKIVSEDDGVLIASALDAGVN